MTSLADELKADQDPRTQCRVCTWIETLDEALQEEWDRASADRSYTHASFYRALMRRDVKISKGSVENHRSNRHRPWTPEMTVKITKTDGTKTGG